MARNFSRLLYALSAAIFALGGLAHAAVYFRKSDGEIGASNLAPFTLTELKALWLCDSTTLIGLAIVFFYLAARPGSANRTLVSLMALIPVGTTFLLYAFLGAFYAAHLLLAAVAMILAAALLAPQTVKAPSTFTATRA